MKKLLLIILLIVCVGCSTEKIIGEGKWIEVKYLNSGFATAPKTIITFDDGSTYLIEEHMNIKYPVGTYIVIKKYKYFLETKYRIETK